MTKEFLKKYGIALVAGILVLAIALRSQSSGPASPDGTVPVYVPVDSTGSGSNIAQEFAALSSGFDALAENQARLAEEIAFAGQSQANTIAAGLQALRDMFAQSQSQGGSQSIPGPTYQPTTRQKQTILAAPGDIALTKTYLASKGILDQFEIIDASIMDFQQTRNFLMSNPDVIVVGGEEAVGGVSKEEAQGLAITRIWGADRYQTLENLKKVI